MREIGPQLLESFSRLQNCQSAAIDELLAARKRMLDRGVSVRQEPVIALGTSGRFALDIACEKVKRAVGIVETALEITHDPGRVVEYIGWLEDSTTPDWTAFCHHLEMEARDATGVLAPAGDGEATATPAQPQGVATGTKPRGSKPKAEKEIRIYIVERQTYYDSLKPRCQQNDTVAIRQAETMFGRNALVVCPI